MKKRIASSAKGLLAMTIMLALVGLIAWAATWTDPLTTLANYVFSDSGKITVAGGVAKLLVQKPFHQHDSKTEFDAGTYTDTEFATGDIGSTQSGVKLTDSGLVAYYPLNGTAGAIANLATAGLEDSKSTNEGTANNANSTGMAFAAAKFGNGVSLDGTDDYVSVPNAAALNPSANVLTLSAWVKSSTVSRAILSKGTVGTDGYTLKLDATGYPVFVKEGVTGGTLSATSAVTDNTWHHVAAVASTSGMFLYIDGTQNATNANTGNFVAQTAALTLGKSGAASSNFSGTIDDIALYNRALTANEIQALYASGVSVHMKAQSSLPKHAPKLSAGYPGLVAYWPFDNSSGLTAPDIVGYYKGTLTNMETPTDWVTGINGKGLDFDGLDEYVDAGDNLDFGDAADFTFSGWFNRDTATTDDTLIAKRNGILASDTGYIVYLDDADDKLYFEVSDGIDEYQLVSTTAFTATGWNHFAIVWDQDSAANSKIYVNGANDSATATGTIANVNDLSNAVNLRVGAESDAGEPFDGKIDEVAFFNRALTANEVLMLAGKKGEAATYTSPAMDGEIAAATWDKITTVTAGINAGANFHRHRLGSGATAMQLADMDGDGDMDFVRVHASNGSISWIENLSGRFASNVTVTETTVIVPDDIAAGDLTADKALDFVVVDKTNGGVKWFKNNNALDPTFTEQDTAQISTDASPTQVALGDIDADGDLDVIAGYSGTIDKITWYLSSGGASPTFTAQTDVATGFDVAALIVSDINGDGWLDIVAGSTTDNKLSWYKGNGGSSWVATAISITLDVNFVRAADIDSDGDKDLAIAATADNTLAWYANDGSATPPFSSITNISATYTQASSIVPGDFDGDGDVDFVTSSGAGGTGREIWKNNGSQSFSSTNYSTASRALDMDAADIDGNGTLDVLDGNTGDAAFDVYLNLPFAKTTIDAALDGANRLFASDIDADGDLDLAVAADGATTDQIGYYKQTSAGVFGTLTNAQTCATPASIYAADLSTDGKVDLLAVCGGTTGLNRWIQGVNADTWTINAAAIDATVTTGEAIAVALDGGRTDILVAGGNKVDWWKQNETTANQYDAQTDIEATWSAAFSVHAADLDNDGDLDVLAGADGATNEVAWWAQTSTGVFGTKTSISTNFNIKSNITTADLDKDGDLDVIAAGWDTGNKLAYWLNSGGSFVLNSQVAVDSNLTATQLIKAVDFDQDGDVDIVATSGVGDMVKFYENDGSLNFAHHILVGLDGALGLVAEDLDNDGLKDIAVAATVDGDVAFFQGKSYSNVKLQLRTHTADPLTTSYAGPDETAKSFFGSGAGVFGPGSTLDSKRYAQYEAFFYRNDATLDPMLKSVRLDYTGNTYSTTNPYVEPATGQAFTYLTSFADTETEPLTSAVKYVLSPNSGTTWYRYNGTAWVTTTGTTYAEANADTDLTTAVMAAFDDKVYADGTLPENSTGTLKYRAFLNSDGTALPTLDQVDIGYETGSITVSAPNGSEFWKVGTSQNITWTSTGVLPADLTLEYATDGTTFSNSIATGEINDGTYTWSSLPSAAISIQVKVRIRSSSVPSIRDASNTNLTVYDLKVTAPNTAVSWPAGSSQNITWTHSGIPGTTVKLQVSTDAAHTTWTDITTALNKTTGTPYPWTVPSTLSATAKVRIIDESQALVTDDSNVDFEISGSIISVTKPASAEVVGITTVKKINWDVSGPIPTGATMRLEYSKDGLANNDVNKVWTLIDQNVSATGGTGCDVGAEGCYDWAVPSAATSNTVVVKVLDRQSDASNWSSLAGGQNAVDGISAVFRVTGTVTVIKPDGGEKWAYAAAHTVSYQTQGSITNVKITAAKDGDFTNTAGGNIVTISASTSNTGSFSWTPVVGDAATTMKVRVEDAGDAGVKDESNAAFSVTGITVTAPSAALRLKAGDPYSITWTQTGIANVKIEYAEDGATYNNTIIASTPVGANSYTLPSGLPVKTMTGYRVKISDVDAVPPANGTDTALSSDSSDNSTVLYGTITATYPNGNEDLAASNPHNITWTVTPSNANVVPNVKIFYTTASFATETIEIDTGVTKPSNNNPGNGTGTYTWSPAFTAATVKIRVVDAADPAVSAGAAAPSAGQNQDDSDAYFQVSGISISAPTGSSSWTVASASLITAPYTGTLTNVKVEYSVNGGTSYSFLGTGTIETSADGTSWTAHGGNGSNIPVPGNPLRIRWTVPDNISTNVKIKITQVNSDGSLPPTPKVATSPAFTITGALSITTPATLTVGASATISWTKTGTITSQTLEYSTDGGTNWVNPAIATAISGTSQGWTVPDTIGPNVKLRITDTTSRANGSPATSSTTAAFSIKGNFAFTAPVTSTEWAVSGTQSVTWGNTGSVSTAKLEYATDADNYAAWTQIATNIANSGSTGSQSWASIPDLVGGTPNPPAPLASPTNGKRNVKLRLTDIASGHTGNAQAVVVSDIFKVKWFLITFNVTNADGNTLATLNVTDSVTWNIIDSSLTSPSSTKRHYKYSATETATWSKTNFTATTTTFTPDADKTITVVLDSENPTPYEVNLHQQYAASAGTLGLSLTLTKVGVAVTSGMTASSITVYDTNGTTVLATLTQNTADANGVFKYTAFTPSTYTMSAGNTYTAKCSITVNGVAKTSMKVINFTAEAHTQNILSLIGAVGDSSSINSLFGKIASTKASSDLAQTAAANAESKSNDVKTLVGATGDAKTADSLFGKMAKVTAFLGDPTSPASGTLAKAILNPWRSINTDPFAEPGQKVKLRFEGETGKSPTVDIYNPSNSKLVSAGAMTEIGSTGVYEYSYTTPSSTTGKYTVMFKEPTSGALDSFLLSVNDGLPSQGSADAKKAKNSADSAFVFAQKASGDTSAILAELAGLSRGQVTDNTSKLVEIQSSMNHLESQMARIFSEPEATNLSEVRGKLDDVLRIIHKIASSEKPHVNLENIYKSASQTEATAKNVKNSVAEVKALAEVTQKMVELQNNKPVVQQWFENGSVILKLLVVNPSETEAQDFPLKAFLPREARPEIIERISEGVEVVYDPDRDAYYVKGDLQLKPGETRLIEIEMTDIWVIEEAKLTDLRDQSEKLFDQLRGTAYEGRAEGLYNNVLVLLTQVFETQNDESLTPEEHINAYRDNMKKVRDIELDLVAMRRFIATAAGEGTEGAEILKGVTANWNTGGEGGEAGQGPSVKFTWKLIFGIMGFIGLVGLVSFGIWHNELQRLLKVQSQPLGPIPDNAAMPKGADHAHASLGSPPSPQQPTKAA